jgi:hypothetical protein
MPPWTDWLTAVSLKDSKPREGVGRTGSLDLEQLFYRGISKRNAV